MIAFQKSKNGFSERWINYCEKQSIPFKLVDFYDTNIIEQLKDCNAVMWHFSHAGHIDFLMAKPLLFSLLQSGKKVFPDFKTIWHFDDKLGQKYLLEAIDVPFVKSWIFYDRTEAMRWVAQTQFPKVFKLRGGAGSVNVRLVQTPAKAKRLINRAFGPGFKHNSLVPFSEVFKKYRTGKVSGMVLIKSFARLFIATKFSKNHGREKGYIYFQDFIPGNDHDIRVIVIGDKAFAIKRMVRKNDFRASGSGHILYEKENFKKEWVKLAFEINDKIQSQSLALDYVFENGIPKVIEISYGFVKEVYDSCAGYWDKEMNWYEGPFDPYGWMVEEVLRNKSE